MFYAEYRVPEIARIGIMWSNGAANVRLFS